MNGEFVLTRSVFLGLALLAISRESAASAQQTGKNVSRGHLSPRTPAAQRRELDAFRHTLSGLGYQEGGNLEIIYQYAAGDFSQLPSLMADLLREKPDAIVTSGTESTAAAKRATRTVPIVMTATGDPLGAGLVASLARPGGNITGITSMEVELVAKRLQLLKEVVPRIRRAAVVRNPSNINNLAGWRVAQSTADRLGIQVVALDIRSADQIEPALKTVPQLHVNGILVLADGVTGSNAAQVVRLVAAQRLPAVYEQTVFTTAGGLMKYAAWDLGMWSGAATYVDRIFKGAKPADLPVERPTTFELIVNLKAAREIGITVPRSGRAHELRILGGCNVEPSGDLCRPYPQRCETCGSAGRTPHNFRVDRESKNRAQSRDHDPTVLLRATQMIQ